MKNIFLLYILFSIVCLTSCKDKTPFPRIVFPEEATTNEKLAALEIQRYIYTRTGKIPEIKSIGKKEDIKEGNIVVGAVFAEEWLEEIPDSSPESFLLKESENSLYIAGKTDVATLHAAYRYAELLGIRFYLHGDVIPDEKLEDIPMKRIAEYHTPLFETRGLQPFHDFPEGPDWWNEDTYKAYFSQMVKMRLNFFGLHTYPENGPHAEPSVWIGLKEDVKENGEVTFSYRTTFANTAREGHWGYAPMKTSEFVAGASLLFEKDIYGNNVLQGLTSQELSPEQCNELFNRQGKFFNNVFSFARQYGIKITTGLETPLVIPEALKSHLLSKGLSPDSPETIRHLYEGIYYRISKAYPIDYFWLWTPEDWTWGNPTKQTINKTFEDIDIALNTLETTGKPFGFGLCGWVLGPPVNRSAFDNTTLEWVALSCINRHLGFEWVDPGFRTIEKNRPKWVIPWLEDDHAMIQPQFWVGRVRRDAADALSDNCTGLIGIHWRSKTIAHNISALAQAGWSQKDWNPEFGKETIDLSERDKRKRDLSSADFYSDWIKTEFGENMVRILLPVFTQIDGGEYIPENAQIANLPRPSSWDTGPGGIIENTIPWEKEKEKYAFVDTLISFKDHVQGAGNKYRFDYWLAQFNYLRQIGKTGCTRGLLANKLSQIRKTSSEPEKENLKNTLIEVRVQLSRDWEELMTASLEAVYTPGEMGNIANLEQHNRNTLQFLTKYDEEIMKITGKNLPEDITLRKDYNGKPRFFVPTVRTLLSKEEPLHIKTIVLEKDNNQPPVIYYRPMGKGDYKTVEMKKINRGVYETNIPKNELQSMEYYIRLTHTNGETTVWPATAPEINQTVIIH